MKKKEKHLRRKYKMPHLFLNDLIQIEGIFKEAHVKEYEFTTSDSEYNEVSEIEKDIKNFQSFETNSMDIKSHDPYISLTLTSSYADLYSSEDDIKSQGIFSKIDLIIVNSERKYLWFFVQIFLYGGWFFVYPLLLGSYLISREHIKSGLVYLTLSTLIFIFYILSFRVSLRKFSLIEFIKKTDRPNFFKRYKYQIILSIFSGVIGTAIGTVIGFLLYYLFFK